MAVFRIEKTKDYTVMSNHHLRNNELSLKAKGLLSLMLSLPEDWDYTLRGLSKICKDGIDSIRVGVQELEAQGYLVRQRVRLPNGQLGSVEYTILEQPKPKPEKPTLEKPMLENPTQVKPTLDSPTQEIPTQLNKDILNTIKGNLTGMFDSVNTEVGEIAGQVGQTPQGWNGGVFSMIQNLSETVIVPIAGVILTFVMCYELIQLVTERNNLHDIDTWMFFKWVFKTFCAVLIVTNTWNIVMGIFDVAQNVVNASAGVIIGDTSVDVSSVLSNLDAQIEAMTTGELFGLWFQSIFVGLTMNILSICIMLVVYGRMIEVYLTTSVGPILLATMTNRDWGTTGQNYLRSLFALGFQAFLIMVCVGIYSVLVQSIGVGGDVSAAIWTCMGYTVLLCFALFKTGSLSKSLFGAH